MFLKNKNIIFKIRRSKVTDYAALNTDKQETFGDNNETPPTVERLTDHVTFMPHLKHRFIGSSYFIFTPESFYSCLKKRKKQ